MNQPAPGSTFDAHWLRLREAADLAARDPELTRDAAQWLALRKSGTRVFSLVDLASGGGSNLHFLAANLPGPQRWRLIDHDVGLLAQASARFHEMRDGDGHPIELISDRRDLNALDTRLLDGSDLICASAFFDLVSRDWVERLADGCAERRVAALFTLTVDGDWHFTDRAGQPQDDAEDRWVRAQVTAHQRRDKGFGPALGGDAPRALADAFARHAYRVSSAPSPWRLPAGQAETLALGQALLDGWAQAVREQVPHEETRLLAWHYARRRALAAGTLGLWVGHVDVFARPDEVI